MAEEDRNKHIRTQEQAQVKRGPITTFYVDYFKEISP